MRPALGASALFVVGLGAFEAIMQPSAEERLEIGVIFGLMALATALAAGVLPRLARRISSLRTTVFALSVISFVIVVFGLVAAAQRMFLSEHDLSLLLVVVGFGVSAALVFGLVVSGPLTNDLSRIASTAANVTSGRLDSRSGVVRRDEVGHLAIALDDMARNLQEAERAQEDATDARMAFFAAVGHDLRTPLASLQAAVEAMQDGVAAEPARFLDSMERDIEALSRLVDDLFLLARLESGSFELESVPIDLTEMADEAIEMIRPIARRAHVTLRLDAGRRVLALAGPEAVARVLRNLLDNAVRHSPPGGEVVITVWNGSSASASVAVADDGPGFPPEFVDHAFDRFSRDDQARERTTGGAGLGLAIAQGFVAAFGGEIWADSGPGGKVTFCLPGGPSAGPIEEVSTTGREV